MTKVNQLLAILDLPEDKQKIYLAANGVLGIIAVDEIGAVYSTKSLADIAFRLRNKCHDPFGWCAWDRACWEVWKYYHKQRNNNIFERKHLPLETREGYCLNWMLFWADPIHWIIAALITKEIADNPEEKFDAHLTEENKIREVDGICKRCGGVNGNHKQVNDPISGDSHMLTKMQCPFDVHEKRTLAYGIAQNNGDGVFGFWEGPNPSLKQMLAIDGRDSKTVLFRFNEDGTDEVIYCWVCSEWMKVIGKYEEDG